MKFIGIADNFGLAFDQATLNRRTMFLKNLKSGAKIVEEVKYDRANKTQRQCAAIFGCFVPIIREKMFDIGMDFDGLKPSVDMIKDWLYQWCGGVGDHGESKTLSKMDVTEAGRFIENIKDCCAVRLDGLQLPELNPAWKEHFNEAPK